MITENSIKINVAKSNKISASMPVFYNPQMESNRSVSILLLNSLAKKKMNIALPLAGSGIRALRFLAELKKDTINHIFVNDKKENFKKTFQKNLTLNTLSSSKISIHNDEASLFLLNQINNTKPRGFCGYFDYIDIDPFGSPNPFLSAAVARISRGGIIAVTATDTSALSGTYPKATKRKYQARIQKNHMMHEMGLRILIRKIQLQGIQFNKALTPILAYYKDHYVRIYFESQNGKQKSDTLLAQHQFLLFNPKTLEFEISKQNCKDGYQTNGPMWVGSLHDKKLLKKMSKASKDKDEKAFLTILEKELDTTGFYDLHVLEKKYKKPMGTMPSVLLKVKGTRTHFSPTGFKTEKNIKKIVSSKS